MMDKQQDIVIKNKKKQIHLILCSLLLGTISIAMGQDLKIAVGEYTPYISSAHRNHGVWGEIITKSFMYECISTKIEYYPWARVQLLIDNEHAVSFGWSKDEVRLKKWQYSDSYAKVKDIFITTAEKDIRWQTYADLKSYKIGVTRGYNGPAFDEYMNHLNIELANSDLINLKKLLYNRIDIIPMTMLHAVDVINDNFDSKTRTRFKFIKEPIISEWGAYLVCKLDSIGCTQTIDSFNKGLAKLKQKGELSKITEKASRIIE